MKEVIAILRPGKWAETSIKLAEAGFGALTRHRIYGCGKQRGLRYGSAASGKKPAGITLLPKWMVHLVVEDEQVELVVKALIEANRTGQIGDGKIFVSPLLEAASIRGDEAGKLPLDQSA